jgi:hypothetical protein
MWAVQRPLGVAPFAGGDHPTAAASTPPLPRPAGSEVEAAMSEIDARFLG